MQAKYGLFKLAQLNVLQVMFLSHLFAQSIPSFIMFLDPEKQDGAIFLFYCSLSAFLIPLGGMLADFFLQVKSNTQFYLLPIDASLRNRRKFANFYLVYLAFCTLIFFSYVLQAPSFPIYELIFDLNDAFEHQEARREASTRGIIYGIALRFFMPVLFLISFASLRYFKSNGLIFAATLATFMALIYNLWPGSKTPVATLFLLATFVLLIRSSEEIRGISPALKAKNLILQRKTQKRAKRLAIILGVLALLYPVFVYLMLPAGQNGLEYVITSVFQRIFFKPAENSYATFEMFLRGGYDYTYLTDITTLASIFGWEHVRLSTEVAVYRGFGDFTNSPPAAVGNFYAQGGGIGVVVGVIFASFLFRLTENLLRSTAKTLLTVSLYAVLIFGAFRFSWANFHSMVVSEVFLPMLFVWCLWLIFGRTSKFL